MRVWGRLTAASLLGALGLILLSSSAFAHAALKSSNPRDGSRLSKAPEAVTLNFTEPPELSLSQLNVLDSTGESVVSGSVELAADEPLRLRVLLEPLAKGSYTVNWRTVSKADGHASAGAFSFGVGAPPDEAPPPRSSVPNSPSTSIIEILGRFGLLLGLAGLVGAASVAVVVFGGTPPAVRNYAVVGWAVAALGLVVFGSAQLGAAGSSVARLLATSIGRALMLRTVGLIVAGAGLVIAWRSEERARIGYTLAALGAASVILAHVAAGHAAAVTSLRWVNILSQWVHFAAVGVWLGGLAALLLGTRRAPGPERSRSVRRFSSLAGWMLVIVAVSGVFRAINELRSWDELFGSNYGRVVLIKVGLLAILAVLGGINRYRNVPRVESSLVGLIRMSRVELVFAVVTLVAAAVLASLGPPAEQAVAASPPSAVVVAGSDFTTSVRARLEVTPGFAGTNRFSLRIADYDSNEPISARRVTARFAFLDRAGIAQSMLTFRRAGPGIYEATGANLSLDGRWRATITVEREAQSLELPLRLATRCRARALHNPGMATIYEVPLPDGDSLQGYLDPGEAGLNQIHATYFDQAGGELGVEGGVKIRATRSAGHSHVFRAIRLSPGHFAANATLDAGKWRFEISAVNSGSTLGGCFEETVRLGPAAQ